MARFGGSSRVAGVAVAAGVAETLLQLIAAANHRVVLTGYSLNGTGVSNTEEPGEWDLMRQTDAGTSSGGTITKDDNSLAETMLTTALDTFSVEPSASDILRSHTVHPQASLTVKEQHGREKIIGGGDRMGLRADYVEGQNVGVSMDFEE